MEIKISKKLRISVQQSYFTTNKTQTKTKPPTANSPTNLSTIAPVRRQFSPLNSKLQKKYCHVGSNSRINVFSHMDYPSHFMTDICSSFTPCIKCIPDCTAAYIWNRREMKSLLCKIWLYFHVCIKFLG